MGIACNLLYPSPCYDDPEDISELVPFALVTFKDLYSDKRLVESSTIKDEVNKYGAYPLYTDNKIRSYNSVLKYSSSIRNGIVSKVKIEDKIYYCNRAVAFNSNFIPIYMVVISNRKTTIYIEKYLTATDGPLEKFLTKNIKKFIEKRAEVVLCDLCSFFKFPNSFTLDPATTKIETTVCNPNILLNIFSNE